MSQPLIKCLQYRGLLLLAGGWILLLAARPAASADILQGGNILVVDLEYGFNDPVTWAGIAQVDSDIDAVQDPDPASEIQFLFDDEQALRRAWNLWVISTEEVYITDSFADPAGLGDDPNPENNDLGLGNDTGGHGALWLINLDSDRLDLVSDGTRLAGGLPPGVASAFTGPRDVNLLPDGSLIVIDPDSNASGLGFDTGRPDILDDFGDPVLPHAGVGGVLEVDPQTGEVTLVSDGSNYSGSMPDVDNDGSPDASVFVDPWAVTFDPSDASVVYLLDAYADPTDNGLHGGVFRVDRASGQVDLIASDPRWELVLDIVWKESLGQLLVLDTSLSDPPDPRIYQVDPATGNVVVWADPNAFEVPVNMFVDENDSVYVVDYNADPLNFGFLVGPGAVFRLPDATPNLPLVVTSTEETFFLATGAWIPTGPYPVVDPLVPPSYCAGSSINVNITGSGFDPAAVVQGIDPVVVNNSTWINASNMTADITIFCSSQQGSFPVRVVNPDNLSDTTDLTIDLALGDPTPPISAVGNLNGDSFIDGLDLAEIGLAFGAVACCDPQFNNDADLNNDGTVDGQDITIFATSFGIRF